MGKSRYINRKGTGSNSKHQHNATISDFASMCQDKDSGSPFLTLVNSNNEQCMARAMLAASSNKAIGSDKSFNDETMWKISKSSQNKITDTEKDLQSSFCKCKNKETLEIERNAPDNWQIGLLTPTQRLNDLYTYGHLTDVTITFPDSDAVYKAHRLILASASPVFEKMFYGDMSNSEAKSGKVCMYDCSPEAVKWLLDNLYCGKLVFSYVHIAMAVFNLAHMYQIVSVLELAKEFLKREMSINNVSVIFQMAQTYSEKYLLDACLKRVSSDWSQLTGDRYTRISEELWMYLLKSAVLPISEADLLVALVTWCKHTLEKDGKKACPGPLRHKVQKFLPYIRLLAISPTRFIDDIMPMKIFNSEETTIILMKIRGLSVQIPPKVKYEATCYSRVSLTDDTLKFAVLTKPTDNKRVGASTAGKITFIDNFTVSFPILLYQISTSENNTLRDSQMTLVDTESKVVGVARPVNSQWRFLQSVYVYPNKSYKVMIDRALIYSRTTFRKDFTIHSNDLKFKGQTCESYFRMAYWPAHPKDY